MTNKEIKNIKFNSSDISKLYFGDLLVWQREGSGAKNKLRGSFVANSSEDNWWYKDSKENKITLPVDPVTKQFEIEIELPTICNNMFAGNSWLKTIDEFPDTSNVTSMRLMFHSGSESNLISVNFENFNTKNVTNFYHFLSNRQGITEIKFPQTFDTSSAVNMEYMFSGLQNIKTLDVSMFNTKNVTTMNGLFYMNSYNNLRTINLGNNWDMSKVTDTIAMFEDDNNLVNVYGTITGIGKVGTVNLTSLDLYKSPLSNSSAMVFINGLANVGEAKRITFKQSTYDTLTEEQIAVATSKGWSVVRSAYY